MTTSWSLTSITRNAGAKCYLKACIIQDGVVIGDGSIILEGAVVQKGAQLEPGSVVPAGSRIPEGELWGGHPLKFVRKLELAEIEHNGGIYYTPKVREPRRFSLFIQHRFFSFLL